MQHDLAVNFARKKANKAKFLLCFVQLKVIGINQLERKQYRTIAQAIIDSEIEFNDEDKILIINCLKATSIRFNESKFKESCNWN